MCYKGKIQGGVVVLELGACLAEGAEVRVELVEADEYTSLQNGLMQFAGAVKGLPADMARNHDHYIHGAPKQ